MVLFTALNTSQLKVLIMRISFDIVSENPLCLIFNNVNGYIIEESNRHKYFIFASTKNNRKVLEKYTKLWNEIKNRIETINGGECNSI